MRYDHWAQADSHRRVSACNIASLANSHQLQILPFALHVTDRGAGHRQRFAYRQVGIVVVTVVNGSYDPGPPRPPTDVANFRRLVPADT